MAKHKGSEGCGETKDRAAMIFASKQGRIDKRARKNGSKVSQEENIQASSFGLSDLGSALTGAQIAVETTEDGKATFEVEFLSSKHHEPVRAVKLVNANGVLSPFVNVDLGVKLPLWALTKEEFFSPMKGEAAKKQEEMWWFLVSAMSDEQIATFAVELSAKCDDVTVTAPSLEESRKTPLHWERANNNIQSALASISAVHDEAEIRFGNVTSLDGRDGFAAKIVASEDHVKIFVGFVGEMCFEEGMVFDDRIFLKCMDGKIPPREVLQKIGEGRRREVTLSIFDLICNLNKRQQEDFQRGLTAMMIRVKETFVDAVKPIVSSVVKMDVGNLGEFSSAEVPVATESSLNDTLSERIEKLTQALLAQSLPVEVIAAAITGLVRQHKVV